jgi:uncharacterized protein (UPF0276 family)
VIAVGFSLAPGKPFIERCAPVFAAADYMEVLPESLVDPRDSAGFRPNGYFRMALELQQRHGLRVVAHGTGLSVCTAHPLDGPRTGRWLERAAVLAERLGLEWYTDHAGITAPAGLNLTVPLDVPRSRGARDAARARLAALGHAIGAPVGVENSVFYAPMSDPADEPRWLHSLIGDAHVWVLDVHNLWTHALNFGLDIDRWLDDAPLHRVIELHVSGGSQADPRWTDGVPWRLDSHAAAVPEPVWALLAKILPRCAAARGVTLERLDGTVEASDVPILLAELARIRETIAAVPDAPKPPPLPSAEESLVSGTAEEALRLELRLADAWSARDPLAALQRLADAPDEPAWVRAALAWAVGSPVGVGLTRRLILRQRFERLLNGSAEADSWFTHDPASFARAFSDYAAEVPPAAFLPVDEAELYHRWLARSGHTAVHA